jgi:hypothetical protein
MLFPTTFRYRGIILSVLIASLFAGSVPLAALSVAYYSMEKYREQIQGCTQAPLWDFETTGPKPKGSDKR